jgi:FkbM family methyltransferase
MKLPNWFSREKRALQRLSFELDQIEKRVPMNHSYTRIDPYIIERSQGGHSFRFIVFHEESRAWYDTSHPDGVLSDIDANGLLSDGDVCFDLGCNAGFITMGLASRVGKRGKVVAFDPYPWNAAATNCNAILNGFSQVGAYPIGIGKDYATITISAHDSKTIRNEAVGFEAQLKPLSAFAKYRPTFIKVDIEGAEADVAEVPFSAASDRLKVVAMEFHPEFIEMRGISPLDVLRKFEAQGLKIHTNGFRGPLANLATDEIAHYYVMTSR